MDYKNIEFKAKEKDSNNWVYGFYVSFIFEKTGGDLAEDEEGHFILPFNSREECNFIPIKKETLCMFTGEKDINNKKIYTRDIVKGDNTFKHGIIGEVIFHYGSFEHSKSYYGYEGEELILLSECEVLGNVIDKTI